MRNKRGCNPARSWPWPGPRRIARPWPVPFLTNWAEVLSRHQRVKGIHPAADLFPLLEEAEFSELCNSIKRDGLDQPIVIDKEGRLLDGRNRLLACDRSSVEPLIEVYDGTDPVGFSLRANLHRRHLNQGQKAMVALKVEEIFAAEAKKRQQEAGKEHGRGQPEKLVADLRQAIAPAAQPVAAPACPPAPQATRAPKASEQAAAALGTSGRSVQMAKAVIKAAPDLAAKVERGQMPLHRAYRETQERQLSQPPPEELHWPEDQLKRRRVVESGGTVVANMHAGFDEFLLRWARSTNRFVRIDRSSPFGNPYEIPGDGERDQVCDSFEVYFQRKFSLHKQIAQLTGKVLGCWCYPERCHGNHLVSLASAVEEDDEFS